MTPSETRSYARRWPIVVRHDAEHDCLISSYRGCSLVTREDVGTFLAAFYVELHRHRTPSPLIAIYDGLYVKPDLVRYYAGGRMQAAARIGGEVYRVAGSAEARLTLATPGDPLGTAAVSYTSVPAAIAQLLRDRNSAR